MLGASIDTCSWGSAIGTILDWAAGRESRYVCICNVHSVITARADNELEIVINAADMATPDGMPVAWYMRKFGFPLQQRINGPDLMWRYCAEAENSGQSVFFYGSTGRTLGLLEARLEAAFPALRIAGMYSPPFRPLTDEEDRVLVEQINTSGAGVVFVGLGCPKQEKWMASHKGLIFSVMIGVGAAFDYHAGTIKRAPLWVQNNGLEWLHRLMSEPRRLWRRYFVTNSLFVILATKKLVEKTLRKDPSGV